MVLNSAQGYAKAVKVFNSVQECGRGVKVVCSSVQGV